MILFYKFTFVYKHWIWILLWNKSQQFYVTFNKLKRNLTIQIAAIVWLKLFSPPKWMTLQSALNIFYKPIVSENNWYNSWLKSYKANTCLGLFDGYDYCKKVDTRNWPDTLSISCTEPCLIEGSNLWGNLEFSLDGGWINQLLWCQQQKVVWLKACCSELCAIV